MVKEKQENIEEIKKIKKLANQSSNATKTIKFLLSMLDTDVGRVEQSVIMSNVLSLRNLPSYEMLKEREIKESINNINNSIEEKRSDFEKINDILIDFENILDLSEELYKRLDKIHFDESLGFYWKSNKHDNISQLNNLKTEVFQIKKKGIRFYSEDEKTNKNILKLYGALLQFSQTNSFRQLGNYGAQFGNNLKYFYDLYMKSLQLLNILNRECKILKEERKNLQTYSNNLSDPRISKKLNDLLNHIRIILKQILDKKNETKRELEIIRSSNLQIIDGLNRNKQFLKSIITPNFVKKLANKKDVAIINDPYYIEAKTSKVFYFHPKQFRLTKNKWRDPNGVFTRRESKPRLFKEKPIFDNDNFYSMDQNINHLLRIYFEKGDKYIQGFNHYFAELLDLVKRSPKLDPQIKGVLIIPSYMEAEHIESTLKQYTSCSDMGKIAIILLENLTIDKKRDMTLAKVQLFKMKHPKVRVYHVFKSFSKQRPIGFIRKYITEYALLLKYYSKHKSNLIIFGGDADLENISRNFFSKTLESFNKNPFLDAVQMKMDFPKDYMVNYPNLWVMHRIFDFAWMYMRNKISLTKEIRMYGPASAIKASSYLMIKGFNPNTKLCEDLQLSWLLDEGRREIDPNVQLKIESIIGKKTPKFFQYLGGGENGVNITTNPRRGISSFLNKVNLLDSYEDFYGKETVKDVGWKELMEGDEKHKVYNYKHKNKLDEYLDGRKTLNVGNVVPYEEIRIAIDRAKKNKFKHEKLALTLSYGLQRYVEWWQRKIDPRLFKAMFKDIKDIQLLNDDELSKWMDFPQFLKMLERVMNWVGIKYEFERTSPYWTFKILNVDKLEININNKMKILEINDKVRVINYNPLKSTKRASGDQN